MVFPHTRFLLWSACRFNYCGVALRSVPNSYTLGVYGVGPESSQTGTGSGYESIEPNPMSIGLQMAEIYAFVTFEY